MHPQRAGAGLHTVDVLDTRPPSEPRAVSVQESGGTRGGGERLYVEPEVFHSTRVCVGPDPAPTAALTCPAKEDGPREIRLSEGCLEPGVLTSGLYSQGEYTH